MSASKPRGWVAVVAPLEVRTTEWCSMNFPDFDVVNPDGGGDEEAEPAFGGVREPRGAVGEERRSVHGEAHLIPLGDEHDFVPVGARSPRDTALFGLQE